MPMLIEKASKDALASPSVTVTTIWDVLPVEPVGGVPQTRPVCRLMLAQAGRPVAVNTSKSPSAS